MNFIWLDDFLALARTGDFFLAAKERHISVTVLRRRIRRLEQWVGTDLVDGSFEPMRLTSAGERFVGVAQDLIARTAQLSQEARDTVSESDGLLRIACTHALFLTFLPDWLRSLGQVSLKPMLRFSDAQAQCEAMLQQGMAQFVLSHSHSEARGALHTDAFMSAVIGRDELIPVSAPSNEGLPAFTLDGVHRSVEMLAYSSESGLGRIHAAALGRQLEAVTSHVSCTASFVSVLRRMALAGKGLAWLPRSSVQDDLSNGALVVAGGKKWTVPLEVRIYRACLPLPRSAEAFWDAIRVS